VPVSGDPNCSALILVNDGRVFSWGPGSQTQLGQNGVAASDGSIWYLGTAAVDGAGDHAIYQLSNGRVTTVCVTSADIGNKWLGMGGPSSSVGLPTGDVNQGSGFTWQNFQSGVIYSSAATEAHDILGNPNDPSSFWGKFAQLGFERGLGLPTGDQFPTADGGMAQHFQNGGIYYAPWTGPRVLIGPIWSAYLAQGAESGPLGLPVSAAPFTTADTGTAAHFEHGGIYYAPWTGPRVLAGPIWDAYLAQGAESSSLGLPVSAAPATTPAGSVEQFQGAVIYWTPGTGANVVTPQGSTVAADGSIKASVAAALDAIQTNAQYLQGYYDTLNSGGTVELKDTKLGQFLQQALNLFAIGNQGAVTLESFSVREVPGSFGPVKFTDLQVHIVISDRVHHVWGDGLGIDFRNRLDVTANLGQLCIAIVEAATGDEPMAWIDLVESSHTKHDVQLPNGQWFTIMDTDWFKPVAQIWDYWHQFNSLDDYLNSAQSVWDTVTSYL
jgi:hypothetical protein